MSNIFNGYCPHCYSDSIKIKIKNALQTFLETTYSYPEDLSIKTKSYDFSFKCENCDSECVKLLSKDEMRDKKINNLTSEQ
jgi:Zn finger protein HypA/HybF involved in hydrogenase expression